MGLRGEVTPGPIHDLFDGKHPGTGEFLIPSRGSNRRARDRALERVVDTRAAAAQLGVRPERVRVLLSRGTLAGTKTANGHWEISQSALGAFRGGDPQPHGGPRSLRPADDATVSMAQAAQLAGVSPRYLRKIAVTEVPPAPAQGAAPLQYLVAAKVGPAWRVKVDEVARFMARRSAARVVEPYDLAVRAPKSVSLLHALGEFVPAEAVGRCGLARGETVTGVILACHQPNGTVVGCGGVAGGFTTAELLAHEAQLLQAHLRGWGPDGTGVGAGLATGPALEAAIASVPSLRAEQREMVERLCTSGVGFDVVHGGPGTGKTFALGVAAQAWRDSGLRVLGCSFQGGAAQVLGSGAALDHSFTLTALLRLCDATQGQVLDHAVVILDEAGMADTRQFSRLASWWARADAKLVAVGDPDQVHEVGAGGGFRHLVDTLGERVITLTDNVRQLDPGDRRRLKMIQAGQAAQAIESARAAGRWHTADTADGVRSLLLQRWQADTGVAGRDKLIIANTVAEMEWFNQAARKLLVGQARLGSESLSIALSAPDRATDSRELRVGDRVRSNRNRAHAGVYTGRIGTVVEVHRRARQVVVAFDAHTDRQGRRLPPTRAVLGADFVEEKTMRNSFGRIRHLAPGLTHAYATTASGVQGRTCERAYVLVAKAGQHRAAAFVAWSRARHQTHLFGLTVPDPDDLSPHQRHGVHPDPDPDDVAELAQAMSREAHQTMATVTDPLARAVGPLLARPTAWLAAARAGLAAALRTGSRLTSTRRPTLPFSCRH